MRIDEFRLLEMEVQAMAKAEDIDVIQKRIDDVAKKQNQFVTSDEFMQRIVIL